MYSRWGRIWGQGSFLLRWDILEHIFITLEMMQQRYKLRCRSKVTTAGGYEVECLGRGI